MNTKKLNIAKICRIALVCLALVVSNHALVAQERVIQAGDAATAQVTKVEVKPVNLAGMIKSSSAVFVGTCLGYKPIVVELAGQKINGTEFTFEVQEIVKGLFPGTKTYKFKLFGSYDGNPMESTFVNQMPGYATGGRYMVFVEGPTNAGFYNTAGFQQGMFYVFEDNSSSDPRVLNFAGNIGLLAGLDFLVRETGLDHLVEKQGLFTPWDGDVSKELKEQFQNSITLGDLVKLSEAAAKL